MKRLWMAMLVVMLVGCAAQPIPYPEPIVFPSLDFFLP